MTKSFSQKIASGVIGFVFCLVLGLVFLKYNPQLFIQAPTIPSPPLVNITAEDDSFYKSKFVSVTAGKNSGSGCIIKPGVYLAAFHVVMYPWLNKQPIYVNGKKATVLGYSHTDNDIVFLTTNPKESKKSAALADYEFKVGEDIVIVGSPGDETSLVEAGKIINQTKNSDKDSLQVMTNQVASIYIESGLSGGCVYPYGSDTPVGIVTKKENDNSHKIGYISLASKILEDTEPEWFC